MYIASENGAEPMTVEALREILKNLPGDAILVCEDGSYVYAAVERAKICRYVAVGSDAEMNHVFVSDDELSENDSGEQRYAADYPRRDILELKHPVLCIETAGAFVKPTKQE